MSNVRQALYGQTNDEQTTTPVTEATNEFEIKTQGKNFAKIKSGKENIDVPRARYVKELEDRIQKLEKENTKAQTSIRALNRTVDSLSRSIVALEKEVKGKMDKF